MSDRRFYYQGFESQIDAVDGGISAAVGHEIGANLTNSMLGSPELAPLQAEPFDSQHKCEAAWRRPLYLPGVEVKRYATDPDTGVTLDVTFNPKIYDAAQWKGFPGNRTFALEVEGRFRPKGAHAKTHDGPTVPMYRAEVRRRVGYEDLESRRSKGGRIYPVQAHIGPVASASFFRYTGETEVFEGGYEAPERVELQPDTPNFSELGGLIKTYARRQNRLNQTDSDVTA
ncbi:MAG TPA: hypothetical protein VK674_00075 [Candidatus Limnocylindria bacterium]|nr:hypothetical protein [Candidatus Limnocylindria bacterium]